jgi:hypothetical protein
MTTYKEFKHVTECWMKKNKSGKEMPSDERMLELYESYCAKENVEEGSGIGMTIRKGANAKPVTYPQKDQELTRENSSTSIMNKKANNVKPENLKKKAKIKESVTINENNGVDTVSRNLDLQSQGSFVQNGYTISLESGGADEWDSITVSTPEGKQVSFLPDEAFFGNNAGRVDNYMQPISNIENYFRPNLELDVLYESDTKQALIDHIQSVIPKINRLQEINEEMSNYPAGTENDPSAPWNQEDNSTPTVNSGNQMAFVAGNPEEEILAQYNGSLYVISKELLESNTELEQTIKSKYVGVSNQNGDMLYNDVDIDLDSLLSAAADYVDGQLDGSNENYGAGTNFVFRLTPELAEELWSHNSPLESHPEVQSLIDYDSLQQKYPHAFSN